MPTYTRSTLPNPPAGLHWPATYRPTADGKLYPQNAAGQYVTQAAVNVSDQPEGMNLRLTTREINANVAPRSSIYTGPNNPSSRDGDKPISPPTATGSTSIYTGPHNISNRDSSHVANTATTMQTTGNAIAYAGAITGYNVIEKQKQLQLAVVAPPLDTQPVNFALGKKQMTIY